MFEEIKNSFMFHQAGDEVQGRLAVLDAVIALRIRFPQVETKVLAAILLEVRLEDLRPALLLEDPAVRRARQEPEPGHTSRPVRAQAPDPAAARHETAHDAIEESRLVV